MTAIFWNKKTNRLYSWKASKNCVLVNDENEADKKQLIEAGLLKPAFCVISGCGSLLQRFPNGQLACPIHDRHLLGEDVMGRKLKT